MSRFPSLTVCPLCFPLSLVPASGRAVCASRRGCFPASPASVRPGLMIAPGVLCPVMISGRGSGEYGKLYGVILWGVVKGGSPPLLLCIQISFFDGLASLIYQGFGGFRFLYGLIFQRVRFSFSDFPGLVGVASDDPGGGADRLRLFFHLFRLSVSRSSCLPV